MEIISRLARILLSVIFIQAGSDAYLQPENRAKRVARAGLPEPELLVKVNGATMVFAGLALALNILPKTAAALLIGCLIPTTIVGHPFWEEADTSSRKQQMTQFAKNLGLIGGLLLVLAETKSNTKAE